MNFTVTSVQNDGYGLRIFNLVDERGNNGGLVMTADEYRQLLDTFTELPGEGDAVTIEGLGTLPIFVRWDGGKIRLSDGRWEPVPTVH